MNESPSFPDFAVQENPLDSSVQNPLDIPIDGSVIELSFSDQEEECSLTPQECVKALFDDDDEENQDNSSQLPNDIHNSWPIASVNNPTSTQTINHQPNDSSDILDQNNHVPLETFITNLETINNESILSTCNTASQQLQLHDNSTEKFDQMNHAHHQPVFPISTQVPQINVQNYNANTPPPHLGNVARKRHIPSSKQRSNKRMRRACSNQQKPIIDPNQSMAKGNSPTQIESGDRTTEGYPYGTKLVNFNTLLENKVCPVNSEKERTSEQTQNEIDTNQTHIDLMPINKMAINQVHINPTYINPTHIKQTPINPVHINQMHLNQTPTHQTPVKQTPIKRTLINRTPFNQPHVNQPHVNQPHVNQPHVNRTQIHINQIPTNQIPMNQIPNNQLPTNQLPINQLPFNQIPTNQIPMSQIPINQTAINQMPIIQMPTNQMSNSTVVDRLPEQTGNINGYNIQVVNPITPFNGGVVHVAPPVFQPVRAVQVPNVIPIHQPVNIGTQLQHPAQANFHTMVPIENCANIPQSVNPNNGSSAEERSRSQRQKRRLARRAATSGKRQKQNSGAAASSSRGKSKAQKQTSDANQINKKQKQTKAKQTAHAASSQAAASSAKNKPTSQNTGAAGPSTATGGGRARNSDLSKEERRAIRAARNRQSAHQSRMRKKAQKEELISCVANSRTENANLAKRIKFMKTKLLQYAQSMGVPVESSESTVGTFLQRNNPTLYAVWMRIEKCINENPTTFPR